VTFFRSLEYQDLEKAYAGRIIGSGFSVALVPDYNILRMTPLAMPFPAHLLLQARYCPDGAFVAPPPGTGPGCGVMFNEVMAPATNAPTGVMKIWYASTQQFDSSSVFLVPHPPLEQLTSDSVFATTPAQSPEMSVLAQLRAQLIEALSQYTGFRGLSSDVRLRTIHYMISSASGAPDR
jgi:hypothetical protein